MAEGKGMFKGSSEGGLFVSEKNSGKNNKVWMFLLFLIVIFAVIFGYSKHQEHARKAKIEEVMAQQQTNPTDVQYQYYENGEQEKALPPGTSKTGNQAVAPVASATGTTTGSATTVAPLSTTVPVEPSTEVMAPAVKETKVIKSAKAKLSKKSTSLKSTIGSAFSIQVASFKDQSRADSVVADLKKKNFEPYVIAKDLGDKGTWYRIYVGHFDSKKNAEEALTTLPKAYKGLIVTAKK
ncbi:MAG: SPOR domain-containing protein [Candidatus Omnitrophica bacterium]|nr:SPOR domain-containing protein [Candidatus Omnitrophota bacterium]